MRVSSINNVSLNNNSLTFKRTAVPYPEYRSAYLPSTEYSSQSRISLLVDKISKLFNPEVTKEAKQIKNQIDNLYNQQQTPKEHLMSVLA